ncbi:hypothetical protein QBC44DRAFT_305100 [Cladorrhinum sp. PSN332]|nr:hypothetical protein QBC44DRAFT_305100 [Cladorrhinum sp. PSN332]
MMTALLGALAAVLLMAGLGITTMMLLNGGLSGIAWLINGGSANKTPNPPRKNEAIVEASPEAQKIETDITGDLERPKSTNKQTTGEDTCGYEIKAHRPHDQDEHGGENLLREFKSRRMGKERAVSLTSNKDSNDTGNLDNLRDNQNNNLDNDTMGGPTSPVDTPEGSGLTSPPDQWKATSVGTVRLPFPMPSTVGLPGAFAGANVSDYMEEFSILCYDYDISEGDLEDRFSKWKRWCTQDIRRIVEGIREDAEPNVKWPSLARLIKVYFKHLDPRQDEDIAGSLQDFYVKPISTTGQALIDAIGTHDKLLARVTKEDRPTVIKDATRRFWSKVPDGLKVVLMNRGKSDKEIKALMYKDFREWVLGTLTDGLEINGGLYKAKTGLKPPVMSLGDSVGFPPPDQKKKVSFTEPTHPASNAMPPQTIPTTRAALPRSIPTTNSAESEICRLFDDLRISGNLAAQDRVMRYLNTGGGYRTGMQAMDEHDLITNAQFGGTQGYQQNGFNRGSGDARMNGGGFQPRRSAPPADQGYQGAGRGGGGSWRGGGNVGGYVPVCYYCAEAHYMSSCKEWDSDVWRGLCHYTPDQLIAIGRPNQSRIVLTREEVRIPKQKGELNHYLRAKISTMPDHPAYQVYSRWCQEYEQNEGRQYAARLDLLGEREAATSALLGREHVAMTGMNSMQNSSRTGKPMSAFEYVSAEKVDLYTTQESANVYTHQAKMHHRLPTPSKPKVSIATRAAAQSAKRAKVVDPDEEDEAMWERSEDTVTKTRIDRPEESPVKTVAPPDHKGKNDPNTQSLSEPSSSLSAADKIRAMVDKCMGVKPPLTIGDYAEISPSFCQGMIDYLTQIKSGKQIIEYKGSSTRAPDPVATATNRCVELEEGEESDWEDVTQATEDLQTLSGGPPDLDTRVTRPALMGATADGLWGVISGGYFDQILSGLNIAELPKVETIYTTPIAALTCKQRMDLGVATRETTATIYVAGLPIVVHFFVLPEDFLSGNHALLLGFPFFKDTALTFDFAAGSLISANLNIADKIVKCQVVSDKLARNRQAVGGKN